MQTKPMFEERSLNTYLEKIKVKSKNTQESIEKTINNFERFCKHKFAISSDQIIIELSKSTQENAKFDVLQQWINWNKEKKLAPGTILLLFSHLKSYLHHRGIKLDQQDIHSELSFPHSIQEDLYPLSADELRKLISVANYKKKSLYLAQTSSLMRIGEIVQIRKRDLDTTHSRIIVRIPARITKLKRSRITFFSKEAEKMILPMLNKLDDDDLIWSSSKDPKTASLNEMRVLRRYLEKAGLGMKYETGRNKITTHSFRAYGITKLSRFDANFAKKLAGQKGYLLQYDRMTDDEKLDLYLKYESELLVDSTEKDKITIEQKNKTIKELEEKTSDLQKINQELLECKTKLDELFAYKERNEHMAKSRLS